jgi:hypothetical protein
MPLILPAAAQWLVSSVPMTANERRSFVPHDTGSDVDWRPGSELDWRFRGTRGGAAPDGAKGTRLAIVRRAGVLRCLD